MIILKIEQSSVSNNWVYEIFNNEDSLINGDDELDGGECTGNFADAVDMATDHIKRLSLITDLE